MKPVMLMILDGWGLGEEYEAMPFGEQIHPM